MNKDDVKVGVTAEGQNSVQQAPVPKKLKYRKLGKSGLFVSEIAFGAMTFSDSTWKLPTASEDISHQMLDKYISYGGNFIDTADIYGNGASEKCLGDWLSKKNREDFIIATKARGRVGPAPNDAGTSRKHLIPAIEKSLKLLQTPYIDLFQVHMWDAATPIEETLSTLNDLVRSGKVRYIGASNFTGWQLQKAIDVSQYMGLEKFMCFQPQYHLLCRSTEYEILPVCINEGLGVMCWSPLAGGILSGKYKRGEKPAEGRAAWSSAAGWKHTSLSHHDNDRTWNIIETIGKISEETKHSYAQIALRWLLQKPGVTCPIVGARTLDQLEDNIGAGFFTLTDAQMALLDTVSKTDAPYPYAEFWQTQRDDTVRAQTKFELQKTVHPPSFY